MEGAERVPETPEVGAAQSHKLIFHEVGLALGAWAKSISDAELGSLVLADARAALEEDTLSVWPASRKLLMRSQAAVDFARAQAADGARRRRALAMAVTYRQAAQLIERVMYETAFAAVGLRPPKVN